MNHRSIAGLLTLAAFPFLATAVMHPPHGEPTCVAHWRFHNGVKDMAASPHGLIADSSGNNQHGHAVGAPILRRVSLPTGNCALEFRTDDDRLFIPDDQAFELTSSLTLEAYVRVDRYSESPQGLSYIVFRGDNRAGLDPWFLGIRDTGQLRFQIADEWNRPAVVDSPTPLPLDELIHVAGTFDHEAGVLSLYVNGGLVASVDTDIRPAQRLGGACAGIGIGNLQCAGNQAFRGLIAEVRICSSNLPTQRLLPPTVVAREQRR
jgi:hypothetical protein